MCALRLGRRRERCHSVQREEGGRCTWTGVPSRARYTAELSYYAVINLNDEMEKNLNMLQQNVQSFRHSLQSEKPAFEKPLADDLPNEQMSSSCASCV